MIKLQRMNLVDNFTERLFSGAPSGVIRMQLRELSALKGKQLEALDRIRSFPLKGRLRAEVLDAFGGDAAIIDRLEGRHFLVKAIAEARRANRREMAVDLALSCFYYTDMKAVSVTELRRNFSRIIKEVANGQVFKITRRGKVVVLLIPYCKEFGISPDTKAVHNE